MGRGGEREEVQQAQQLHLQQQCITSIAVLQAAAPLKAASAGAICAGQATWLRQVPPVVRTTVAQAHSSCCKACRHQQAPGLSI